MNDEFTILVNSCDAYEDTWLPFFTLFKKSWPGCKSPIVLNTETKVFEFPGLRITCPTVSRDSQSEWRWGERFLKCLETIETELVLLFLDDYFIKSPVKTDVIYELASLMYKDGLSHVMLVSMPGPNRPSSYRMLLEREQKALYRFSLQVGLWRRDRLRLYVRSHEDPWQCEIWGTKRAWRITDTFFCISSTEGSDGKIVDYDDTGGIARGKWIKEKVVDFFREHDIEVDFSKRGFYDRDERVALLTVLKNKILNFPSRIRSWVDLCLIPRQVR